ncbi:hypothetical protein [Escherichia coli]
MAKYIYSSTYARFR